jgi:glycosyltransferase involved in cell wall biosynthesis
VSTQPSSWPSADAQSSARAPGHGAGAAEPLVSVIIPTYKRAEFLDRAIESALAQSYRPVEVIVVEDGSHDAEAVVSRYGDRVRYIWQENQGAAVARNTGAAVAYGSWLAMLDDDDVWFPEKLDRQLALLRRFPSLGFIHSNYYWLRNGVAEPRPDTRADSIPSGWITEELVLARFSIATSTVLVRADAFRRVGGFNPGYRYVQDYDLWVRLSLVCQFGYLATPLAYYQADAPEDSAVLLRKALTNVDILHRFVETNRYLCRTWPQPLLRGRFHLVHLRCAQRHLWADEVETARAHFLKAWTWSPSRLSALAYGLACMTGRRGIRALRAMFRSAPR